MSNNNTINAIDRASAAINTSIDGVEAGIAVAPFALFYKRDESKLLHGVKITLAALEGDKSRIGVAYSYESVPDIPSVVELDIDTCDYNMIKVVGGIERVREPHKAICEKVITEISCDQDSEHFQLCKDAKKTCGFGWEKGNDAPTISKALGPIILLIQEEMKRLNISGSSEQQSTFALLCASQEANYDKLKEYKTPMPLDSIEGKTIAAAYRKYIWDEEKGKNQFGIGGTMDLFNVMWGFNPDSDKELPDGDISKWQIRSEYAYKEPRMEHILGVGFGKSRKELGDELQDFISVSYAFDYLTCRIVGDNFLNDKGKLNPHLIVGIEFLLDLSLDHPESQKNALEKCSTLFHADFIFTEKLSFRLGIPIQGEISVRKKNEGEGIEEKRELQWSVPIFLTTVLKM